MAIEYEQLSEEFGLDEDTISEEVFETIEDVFTIAWDGGFPGMSGANWIREWRGYYFFFSSDHDSEGPFKSLEEALALENMNCATSNPEIYYDDLPFEKVEKIARNLDEHRQQSILINGERYEWEDDSLRLAEQ